MCLAGVLATDDAEHVHGLLPRMRVTHGTGTVRVRTERVRHLLKYGARCR
jgi:hypothetical protein